MGETSKDVLALLTQLMPGFLTACVVYGLTTYTKPSQFERIVQALIYSFIVSAIVVLVERAVLVAGRFFQLGVWDKSAEVVASSAVALILGLILSYYMRHDSFFALVRRLNLTNRTAYPNGWYGAFARKTKISRVTSCGRSSHFPISARMAKRTHGRSLSSDGGAWIGDDNQEPPLDGDESILIEAKQVEMVEFLKDLEELPNAAKTAESPSVASPSPPGTP
jgi:hypothetical protein